MAAPLETFSKVLEDLDQYHEFLLNQVRILMCLLESDLISASQTDLMTHTTLNGVKERVLASKTLYVCAMLALFSYAEDESLPFSAERDARVDIKVQVPTGKDMPTPASGQGRQ